MADTLVPQIWLADGHRIAQLGFGTFKVPPAQAEASVSEALRVGYRHIDTAALYENEREVGAAIAASGLPRDQIFVTTKLWNDDHKPDRARMAINASLEKLGLDHVDLYLIHWPSTVLYGDSYIDAWNAMQEFKREGLATSIGVSNFNPEHIGRLDGETPVVNQVELHPTFAQVALRADMARRGIVVESWSPLGRGADLDNPVIAGIAQSVGRTTAQVIIRWHLQSGIVVIPKSVTPERIAENFAVTDFELTDDQMKAIDALDCGNRIGGDPATADF